MAKKRKRFRKRFGPIKNVTCETFTTPRKENKFFISKMDTSISGLSKDECKLFSSYLNYDTKLKLILHGEPIADSRPRVVRGIAFSKNIGILRGHFAPLYDQDKLLQNLIIDSPYHIRFKFYMSPSKKLRTKIVGKGKNPKPTNKKIYDLYMKDLVPDLSIKDCDNMVKVYNDLFMTETRRIVLDDGFNIGLVSVDKFISEHPRTEIEVFYSSNPLGYFRDIMHDHYSYFKFRLSEKHMNMYNRDYKQQLSYLKSLLKVEFDPKILTTKKEIVDKLKQLVSYFEEHYKADTILNLVKAIGNMKDYSKINRAVHTNILLLYLFSNNNTVYKILNDTVNKFKKMIEGGEEF